MIAQGRGRLQTVRSIPLQVPMGRVCERPDPRRIPCSHDCGRIPCHAAACRGYSPLIACRPCADGTAASRMGGRMCRVCPHDPRIPGHRRTGTAFSGKSCPVADCPAALADFGRFHRCRRSARPLPGRRVAALFSFYRGRHSPCLLHLDDGNRRLPSPPGFSRIRMICLRFADSILRLPSPAH